MNLVYFILLLIVIFLVYQATKSTIEDNVATYHMGKTFQEGKPILWMHAMGEVNARHWLNFYSRNSTELNQPYLYLTMKSVFDKCQDSFNVCLVDDDAFKDLPGWTHDVASMPSPEKERYRQLGLAKLLHRYGGFLVPNSLLCLKDLRSFYKDQLSIKDAFAVCAGKRDSTGKEVPCPLFMGCDKGSKLMADFVDKAETMLHDNASEFGDEVAKLCGHFTIHDGTLMGTKTSGGRDVILQDLLGTSHVPFHNEACGIFFPAAELLKRPVYGWFARLSSEQIMRSDFVFCKMLLSSY
jgi:hypothetical protein